MQTTIANPSDDLDYMHARFHFPIVGRMLSVDPALQVSRSIGTPQLWNRYSYALGNPTKYVDPTGRVIDERSNGDDCSGFFCRVQKWFSDFLVDAAPVPETQTNSSAQALADDGEIQQSQVGEFDQGKAAAGAQEGLSSFTSIAGAGFVTGAVVIGTNAAGNVAISKLDDIFLNPTLLKGLSPSTANLTRAAEQAGWQVGRLGQGTHAGQGLVLREQLGGKLTDRAIFWHPGGGRHGPEPYWKVSSGAGRVLRIGPQS